MIKPSSTTPSAQTKSISRYAKPKATPLGHEINLLATRSRTLAVDKLIHHFLRPPRSIPPPLAARFLANAQTDTLHICSVAIQVYTFHPPAVGTTTASEIPGSGSIPRHKTILLTHGHGTSVTSLLSFIPPLLAAGCTVVAWDHGGHGASGGEQGDLYIYKETFVALARQHAPVEALIGHSAGATMAGLGLVETQNSISVKKLVFLAPPTRTSSVMDRYCAGLGVEGQEIQSDAIEELRRRGMLTPDGIRDAVVTQRVKTGGGKVDIGKLLLIQDHGDRVVLVDDVEWWRENFENLTVEITKNLGHYRGLSDPRIVDLVTAFALTDGKSSSKL